MKRNLFLSAILVMVSLMSYGQRLDITLDDNTIVSYDVQKIKFLEFMPVSGMAYNEQLDQTLRR